MALYVPPPQTPPALVQAADPRALMPGSEVAEALPAYAAHPTLDQISPDAWFTRPRLAKVFSVCGFPTTPATLATKAVRGGGPPYQLFGKVAMYRWGAAVEWIRETMGEPARTTSEHRARKASPPLPQKPSPAKLAAMKEGSRRYNAARNAARQEQVTAQKKAKPKRAQVAAAPPPP